MRGKPDVSLLTATRGRPEAFRLCERWAERQTFAGHIQWIVVDDGQRPTMCTMGQQYVRREPSLSRGCTLADNLLAAIPLIESDKIVFIEDDDWYAADYVEIVSRHL